MNLALTTCPLSFVGTLAQIPDLHLAVLLQLHYAGAQLIWSAKCAGTFAARHRPFFRAVSLVCHRMRGACTRPAGSARLHEVFARLALCADVIRRLESSQGMLVLKLDQVPTANISPHS